MTLSETTPAAVGTSSNSASRPSGGDVADQQMECPAGRPVAAEEEIVRDVYGCAAGRNCMQVTLAQRIAFETQIADRIAAHLSETT